MLYGFNRSFSLLKLILKEEFNKRRGQILFLFLICSSASALDKDLSFAVVSASASSPALSVA